jgi:type II secretory ATPase GspE/PulE/Tfp pilus assembly ATPase PilB-like protein
VDRQKLNSVLDVTPFIDDLLARGLAAGATDLHFEPVDEGMLVRVRVDGHLTDFDVFPPGISENLVARLKVLASLLTYRVDIPQEGSFCWRGGHCETNGFEAEFRIATFPTVRGERAVVRAFRATQDLQSLASLGLASEQVHRLREAVAQPSGLIVVSGAAGSGKTTTLYAMIREIQEQTPGRSIITLEDPVEQRLNRVAQIQINPHGELSYERCMRSVLRHDPQVILLGEVRDRSTAAIAIEAALTGHLILTTVHSGDAAATIVRFLEMGIPSYQLTSTLTLVCSQRLLRIRCGRCQGLESKGCHACLMSGYSGRTAIAEIAEIDERLRGLILENAPASAIRIEMSRKNLGLVEHANALVASAVTDEHEVARVLGYMPLQIRNSGHRVA